MKTLIIAAIIVALMFTLPAFITQPDPWKVPENYEKMKNPVVSDANSIKSGRELYITHCRKCHGSNGKGTGIKAVDLNIPPSDFTSDIFQKQSDGSLLYKIYFGHKDMPGFKKRIPGNDDVIEGTFGKTRTPGDLINYIRTFGKVTVAKK